MKKQIIAISTVVLLGTAGAALANGHKQSICHNGSTYDSDLMDYVPISFVINISGKQHAKAVAKHVANHDDLTLYDEGEQGMACELNDEGIVECDMVTLCKALPDPV